MNTPERLLKYISEYNSYFPNAWKQYQQFLMAKSKDLPNWPDWCFCPLAAAYAIVSNESNNIILKGIEIGVLGALAAWRMTQGIYRFDTDVFLELWNTSIEGNIPIDIFYHLPEWCIYIEIPTILNIETKWIGIDVKGLFVYLEWDVNKKRSELRFVFDTNKGLFPFMLHLTKNLLLDCITEAMNEAEYQLEQFNLIKAKEEFSSLINNEALPIIMKDISHYISLILYICSINADITDLKNKQDKPQNPSPVKTKHGYKIFPASNSTIWLTGYRIGASLRLVNQNKPNYNLTNQDSKTGKSHAAPRPHIRRAHWHSFWTGPKNNIKERRIVVKWIPPISVGLNKGELIPTIHIVK